MSVSRILKWVTGSFEALLGIPLVGASIVIGSYYTVLPVMLVLHIITDFPNEKAHYGAIAPPLGMG